MNKFATYIILVILFVLRILHFTTKITFYTTQNIDFSTKIINYNLIHYYFENTKKKNKKKKKTPHFLAVTHCPLPSPRRAGNHFSPKPIFIYPLLHQSHFRTTPPSPTTFPTNFDSKKGVSKS